jgi:hypothetical protein
MLMDPRSFLDGLRRRRVVPYESHRLSNRSELLKIATPPRFGQFVPVTLVPPLQENDLSRNSFASRARFLSANWRITLAGWRAFSAVR